MDLMIADTDAAYLAGLIDGEGSVGIVRQKRSHHAFVYVYGTNRVVLDWACGIFGGYIHARSQRQVEASLGSKPQFVWQVIGNRKARPLIDAIIPYVRIKRGRISVIKDFLDTFQDCRIPGGISDEELARRQGFRLACLAIHE
jgi:hypothetical protein